nr:P-loop NTPase [Actinomycetota bacterium]
MARLALALDPGTEDRLLADVVEHGHAIVARLVGWRDVLESLDMLAPEVVLVGAGRDTLSAELLTGCDDRGIRLIALAGGDAERAHAAHLGLHEVVDRSAAWSEIEPLVRGGVPVPARVGESSPRGPRAASLIAVWGPAGAPGRTTIAVNLAAELAAAGHSVALVDADPYGGSVAPSLGLLDEAPGLASACRLAAGGALDRAELERIAQRYSAPRASFDVFTGLVGPSRWPELAADRVAGALAAIRGWVEYVVVDTGFSLERDEELTSDQFAPRRNAATFASLSSADRVVAVGLGDPVGLSRFLRGHGELVDLVDAERIDVVVNRVRTSVL